MTALAATVVRMQAAAFGQQVGTAVVRRQLDAERAVAGLVAGLVEGTAAGPPPPPGQGVAVDRRV